MSDSSDSSAGEGFQGEDRRSTRGEGFQNPNWHYVYEGQERHERKHTKMVTNIKEVFDKQKLSTTDVAEIVNVYERKQADDYDFIGLILIYFCSVEPFSSQKLKEKFAAELHAAAVHGISTDKPLASGLCQPCKKKRLNTYYVAQESFPHDIEKKDRPLQNYFRSSEEETSSQGPESADFKVEKIVKAFKDVEHGRFALVKWENTFLAKQYIASNKNMPYYKSMNMAKQSALKKRHQLKDEDMVNIENGKHCDDLEKWKEVAYVTKEQFPLLGKVYENHQIDEVVPTTKSRRRTN